MRANAHFSALQNVMALGVLALTAFGISAPVSAVELQVAYVTPAELTPALAAERQQAQVPLRPSFAATPALTNDLLQAYVAKQQQLKSFDVDAAQPTGALSEQILLGYIDRTRGTPSVPALDAISSMADQPALNADELSTYAQKKYVPTVKKVQLSNSERLCLTQAIYHEARGESDQGQWAVANVIINRAMSHKFPTTLCGVVFQNADQGFHRCQFTFACDGKSDMGTETGAWNKAQKMAQVAYKEFKQGDTPGVVPTNALYYHTVSVNPDWSDKFKRVATIGAHEFYATR